MSEFGPLYDTAALILTVVGEAFAAVDPEPVTLPDRRYVVPGITPAYDCAQLTVAITTVAVGQPGRSFGAPFAQCPPLVYATYRVDLIREVPKVDGQGRPPKPDKLDAAAQTLLRDMQLLHRALIDARDRIGGGGDPQRGAGVPVAVSNALPVGSDGGVGGSRVDMDVPVIAYADAPPP